MTMNRIVRAINRLSNTGNSEIYIYK